MDLEQRASDERRKWEKPYVFEPYPKMLYRGLADKPGWEHCTVGSEQEEHEKVGNGQGWRASLNEALAHHEKLGADIGLAAAERAAADRKLSAPAQAEAKAAEDAADGHHLGEIPETPVRKPSGKLQRKLSPDDVPAESRKA